MEKARSREEQHKMRSILAGKTLARRTGLLLATMALGLMLAGGVALANQVPCNGSPLLPCGAGEGPANSPSEGNDVFSGSAFDDSMSGFGGDDEGYGHGGGDTMLGMVGNDTFDGGTGNDRFAGGPGDDFFLGAEDDDLTHFNNDSWSGEGDDTLDGGLGNDNFDAGPGDDKLYGGEGVDRLKGNTGGDYLDGGEGNDDITDQSNDANDISPNGIVGGDGDDTISVEGFGRFTIHGDDVLLGVTGNDQIYGGFLDDEILGGPGNDEMSGRLGDDEQQGGQGNDVLGKGHAADGDKDPGQDWFYGGEGDDFILARDGENDHLVDCGEGSEDVAEVDHGLVEWRDTVGCEIIWDGVKPSISAWGPTPSTKDPTPIIQVNARDSHPRVKLGESDVKLYVDGRRVTASYNPLSGLLTYTPGRKLSTGKHTVKAEVVEKEGLKATKTWSFKVLRKR